MQKYNDIKNMISKINDHNHKHFLLKTITSLKNINLLIEELEDVKSPIVSEKFYKEDKKQCLETYEKFLNLDFNQLLSQNTDRLEEIIIEIKSIKRKMIFGHNELTG